MEISDVGAKMLRMLAEGKEMGQDAACRQREERAPFLQLL